LKEKIFAERSDFVVDRQKLIHSGKVLKDTSTVEEIGIKESEFLVCMVTKEVAKV
jgi:UV excision repair protein RAD23